MGSGIGRAITAVGTGGLSETGLGKKIGTAMGFGDAPIGDQSGINATLAGISERQSAWQRILDQQVQQTQAAGTPVDSALNLMQSAASGNAPSQAQAILQRGLDQSIAQQMAVANAGTMGTQLARQRAAADQSAQLSQQTANQASMLRAQEMEAARNQFGGLAQGILGQRLGAQANTMGAIGGLTGTQVNANLGQLGVQTQAEQAQADRFNRLIGAGIGAAGAAMTVGGTSAPKTMPGQGTGGMG